MKYAWLTWRPGVEPGDSLSGFVAGFAHKQDLSRRSAQTRLGGSPQQVRTRVGLDTLSPDEAAIAALDPRQIPAMTIEHSLGYALDYVPVRERIGGPRSPGAVQHTRYPRGWTHRSSTPGCVRPLKLRPFGFPVRWRLGLLPACALHLLTSVSHCPRCNAVAFRSLGRRAHRSADQCHQQCDPAADAVGGEEEITKAGIRAAHLRIREAEQNCHRQEPYVPRRQTRARGAR